MSVEQIATEARVEKITARAWLKPKGGMKVIQQIYQKLKIVKSGIKTIIPATIVVYKRKIQQYDNGIHMQPEAGGLNGKIARAIFSNI